jgi:hypothetical protein
MKQNFMTSIINNCVIKFVVVVVNRLKTLFGNGFNQINVNFIIEICVDPDTGSVNPDMNFAHNPLGIIL